MKKFFKALAVVLALTLLIGTIPASAGVADLSVSKKSKTLYIGGSKAFTAEDAACKIYSKYKVSKLVSNFDKDTMKVELSSSDKSIVGVSNKYGRIYAKGIGTATVTAIVKDIDNDDALLSFDLKVNVKKNATADTLVIKSDEITDGAKVGINTAYTVVLPRKADGAFVDTDARALTCDDKNVTIEKLAATTFQVTFLNEGEYTLKAAAFQSDKYPKYAQPIEKEIKVTAGLTAESVKLVATDTVEVTFDCVISSLDKDNFTASYTVGDVAVGFSSVKNVAVAPGSDTAKVTFYRDFPTDMDVTIFYNKVAVGTINSLKVTADSVADIDFNDQAVKAGEKTALLFKLVDANGIDITSHLGYELKGSLTFALDRLSPDAYVDNSTKAIFIKNVDEVYTVKITYTWFKDGKETKVEKEAKITATAQSPEAMEVVGGLYASDANPAVKSDPNTVFAKDNDVKPLAQFAIGDATPVFQAYLLYTRDGKNTKYESIATPGLYTITSADPSIVMISDKVANGYKIIANQPGSTYIFINDKDGKTVAAVPVTVNPKRESKTLTVEPSKQNINKGYTADTIDFVIKVKDQYDVACDIDIANMKIEQTVGADSRDTVAKVDTATVKSTAAVNLQDKSVKVIMKQSDFASNFEKTGIIVLKFTVNGLEFTQRIEIANQEEAIGSQQVLTLSNKALKTGVVNEDSVAKAGTVVISLTGKTAGGYAAAADSLKYIKLNEVPKTGVTTSSDGTTYYYTLTKAGKDLSAEESAFFDAAANTVKTIEGVGGTVKKLAAGQYDVTLYKVVVASGVGYVYTMQMDSFTVTDDQLPLVVTKKADKIGALESLDKAFEVKFNNAVVSATFDSTDGAGVTFVKTIKYEVNCGSYGTFEISTPVNASIIRG